MFAGNNAHLAPSVSLHPGLAGKSNGAVLGPRHSAMALGTQMGQMAWRSPKARDSGGGGKRREAGGSGKGKGVWELGVGTQPSVGPGSLAIICRRSSRSYEQGTQSCRGSQDGLALTSHAPVDGVHAVIVEEVRAGCLQGRQSQGWPESELTAASLRPLPTSRKWPGAGGTRPQRSLSLKSRDLPPRIPGAWAWHTGGTL